jgi:hypothetical protein
MGGSLAGRPLEGTMRWVVVVLGVMAGLAWALTGHDAKAESLTIEQLMATAYKQLQKDLPDSFQLTEKQMGCFIPTAVSRLDEDTKFLLQKRLDSGELTLDRETMKKVKTDLGDSLGIGNVKDASTKLLDAMWDKSMCQVRFPE